MRNGTYIIYEKNSLNSFFRVLVITLTVQLSVVGSLLVHEYKYSACKGIFREYEQLR